MHFSMSTLKCQSACKFSSGCTGVRTCFETLFRFKSMKGCTLEHIWQSLISFGILKILPSASALCGKLHRIQQVRYILEGSFK